MRKNCLAVCLFSFLLFAAGVTFAQNIAINTAGTQAAATNMFEVTQTSAAANMVALYAINSGATAGTGYGFQALKTGAGTTNIAGYFSASGGTSNYALIVPSTGGNVGIGTIAPAYKVQVDHTGDVPFLLLNTTSGANKRVRLQFGQGGVINWELATDLGVNNGDNLYFYDRTTSTFGPVIFNNGYTGIGTQAPASILSVAGTAIASTAHSSFGSTQWRMRLNGTDETNSATIDYRGFDGNALGIVGAGTLGTNRLIRMWEFLGINTAASTNQALNVSGTNATYAAVFQNGSVGIGTASPADRLEVNGGNILITNGAAYNGAVYSGDINWGFKIQRTAATDDYNVRMSYYPASGTRKAGIFNANAGNWVFYSDANAIPNIIMTNIANVGIGTTAPGSLLHLQSANVVDVPRGDLVLSRYWNTTADTRASSIFHYYNTTSANDNLAFAVAGDGGTYGQPNALAQIKMLIQGSGQVGIGTTTPSAVLQVQKNQNAKTRIKIVNSTAGTGATSELFCERADGNIVSIGIGDPTFSVGTPLGFTGAYIWSGASQGIATRADGGPIRFITLNGGAVPTEFMRVANGGNVGINTASPNSTLHVNGAYQGKVVTVTGTTTLANDDWFILITTAGAGTTITFPTLVSGTTDGKILILRGAPGMANVTLAAAGGNSLVLNTGWINPMTQNEVLTFISVGTSWYMVSDT